MIAILLSVFCAGAKQPTKYKAIEAEKVELVALHAHLLREYGVIVGSPAERELLEREGGFTREGVLLRQIYAAEAEIELARLAFAELQKSTIWNENLIEPVATRIKNYEADIATAKLRLDLYRDAMDQIKQVEVKLAGLCVDFERLTPTRSGVRCTAYAAMSIVMVTDSHPTPLRGQTPDLARSQRHTRPTSQREAGR